MKIIDSFELLALLKNNGYKADRQDPLWWPNSGSFEVVVGAILTQQTKWEHVKTSLTYLKNQNLLDINSLATCDIFILEKMIKPSGFYRKKAKNIKLLCQNIIMDFENFENFTLCVEKEWLLKQKGLGHESCDSILCYACGRETMVVDSYTHRLLQQFGYEFETYEHLQEWMMDGIYENKEKIDKLYEKTINFNEIFARFHGKIVEFCKENMKKRKT